MPVACAETIRELPGPQPVRVIRALGGAPLAIILQENQLQENQQVDRPSADFNSAGEIPNQPQDGTPELPPVTLLVSAAA